MFREINIVSNLADGCFFKTGVKAILMFALQLFFVKLPAHSKTGRSLYFPLVTRTRNFVLALSCQKNTITPFIDPLIYFGMIFTFLECMTKILQGCNLFGEININLAPELIFGLSCFQIFHTSILDILEN
jgi:hypothetical protein